MARNMNPAETPTAKAMDRAIDLAIEGDTRYPSMPNSWTLTRPRGHEITRALDEGYTVVLVSADGRERIINAKTLATSG